MTINMSLWQVAVLTVVTIGDDLGTFGLLCIFRAVLSVRTLQATLVAVSKQLLSRQHLHSNYASQFASPGTE